MLLLGHAAPAQYQKLLQEDRIVEWATVWLFFAAGIMGMRNAVRERRGFDGLVALFCVFVAGEEISWGQRLLGYYPPEFFLDHNFQQEFTLHNLPQSFLPPKWVLMTVLAGYGIILPMLSRFTRPRPLLVRVGATPPSVELVPWFAVAIVLLLWYPLTLTGEWVEVFSGGLFLISTRPLARTCWTIFATALALGAAMTVLTGALEHSRDVGRMMCAGAEARSLVDDVALGDAGTNKLWRMRRIHKRLWSSVGESYVDAGALHRFGRVQCSGVADSAVQMRHKYGLDPWGSSYWLLIEKVTDEERHVSVYSFGPNRRRDLAVSATTATDTGDDIVVTSSRRVKLE
jgi:hypothetical protein